MVRCLSRLGYDAVATTSADDAVELWEREEGRFDLLLTDMVMPGELSGLDLCRRLRQVRSDLPAIITTGYSIELPTDAPAAKGIALLPKPYRVEA